MELLHLGPLAYVMWRDAIYRDEEVTKMPQIIR
jgi:hypothetical protein